MSLFRITFLSFFLAGCATQTAPINVVESPRLKGEQQQAQASVLENVSKLTLKRKIAIGRVSNETRYGRSLIRDQHDDVVGKQLSDMLNKALTESGNFLVLERTDLGRLKDEAALTGTEMNLVGTDVLIIGSLTEYGRKTVGKSGFLSSTKRQVAYAKVEFRLVDTQSGLSFFTTTGSGEASNEASSVAGFGSRSEYDGTLGDKAISHAVSGAVSKLVNELMSRPWSTSILEFNDDVVYISGGQSQGIEKGMSFLVEMPGKKIESQQTGFEIQLPGKEVARIEVVSLFGADETSEGAVAQVTQGSLKGIDHTTLEVKELGDETL